MFANRGVRGAGDGHQEIGAAGALVRELAPERLHVVVAVDALGRRGGGEHVVAHGDRQRRRYQRGRVPLGLAGVMVILSVTGHVLRADRNAGLMLQLLVLLLLVHAGSVEEVSVGRENHRAGVQMVTVVSWVVVRVETRVVARAHCDDRLRARVQHAVATVGTQ